MDIKSLKGKSALDLFPGLIRDLPKNTKKDLLIPPPPDHGWLLEGMRGEDTNQSLIHLTALVIIADDHDRAIAEKILSKMGYIVQKESSAPSALQKLQAVQYNVILCETETAHKDIHKHICNFPPNKRRLTYFAAIGPRFHTLYDLEALALSANVVINNKDLEHLEKILHKGFFDYEKLFGPLLDTLSATDSSF